jgi:site-specific DNA-methyltransferase (adenine-specific)
VLTDPPYGNVIAVDWDSIKLSASKYAKHLTRVALSFEPFCHEGAALYMFGGYGTPGYRPFYRFIPMVERRTSWRMANMITWAKKRAYGVQHNYLSTREECAYFVLGDIKKPRKFKVPYLSTKRGYAGYNKDYPAHSEYLRRTSVWSDVTEIFKGKVHPAQKPVELFEIPILVHTEPGDFVFDPYAGSGTSAISAIRLKRNFIVIEKDVEIYEAMISRIEKESSCK